MKYIITVSSTVSRDYIIEAKSKEDALENFELYGQLIVEDEDINDIYVEVSDDEVE